MVDIGEFVVDGTKEQYCDNMETPGEWADHITVWATAMYLKQTIMVVTSSPDGGSDNTITYNTIINHSEMSQNKPLIVGHVWVNHYLSLCPIDYDEVKKSGNQYFLIKLLI